MSWPLWGYLLFLVFWLVAGLLYVRADRPLGNTLSMLAYNFPTGTMIAFIFIVLLWPLVGLVLNVLRLYHVVMAERNKTRKKYG